MNNFIELCVLNLTTLVRRHLHTGNTLFYDERFDVSKRECKGNTCFTRAEKRNFYIGIGKKVRRSIKTETSAD